MKMTKTLHKYIETAKDIEEKGLKFYRDSLKKVKDPNSKGLLRFLIEEELDHLDYFEKLEGKLDKNERGRSVKKLKTPLFKMEDYKKVKGNRARALEIFNTALEMEERGIKFYTNMAKKVKDDKLKKFLQRLARMEMRHFKLIKTHQQSIYNYWYWEAVEQPRLES